MQALFLVYIAFLFASISTGMVWPFLQIYVFSELRASMTAVGLTFSTFSLGMMIAQYPWGKASDYFGRREPFIFFGLFSSAILFFLFVFVSIGELILIRFLQGIIVAASVPTTTALIADEVGQQELGKAMGIYSAMLGIGWAIGPLLGGFIADNYGSVNVFYVCGLLMLFGALLISFKMKFKRTEKIKFAFQSKPTSPSLGILNFKRNLVILCFAVFTLMTASGAVYSLFSIYLEEIGASETQIGILFSVDSAAAAIISIWAGQISDKFGRKPVLVFGVGSYIVVFLSYLWVRSITLLIPIQILSGIKWAAFIVAANALVAELVPQQKRGGTVGLLSAAISGGWVIGPLIGGYIGDTYDIWTTIVISIIFVFISLFVILLEVKEKKNFMKN